MNSNTMTVTVPDEMQSDVSQWKDGENYQITVTQTAPGQFTLASIDGDGEGDDDDSNTPADANGPTGNPAVDRMMSSTIPANQ